MIASFRARGAWLGRLRAGFATLALLSAAACGGNPVEAMPPEGMTDTTTPFSCTPGAELDCSCADGRAGKQLCLASGFEVSGCMCSAEPSSTGDTTGTDPTESTESTGTSADGSTGTSSSTDEPSDGSGTDESTGTDTDESIGTSGSTEDTGDESGSTGGIGADDE